LSAVCSRGTPPGKRTLRDNGPHPVVMNDASGDATEVHQYDPPMSVAFAPITIRSEEVEQERSYPIRGPLFRIHFRLSEEAPAEWAEAFSLIWAQCIFYRLKRRAGVEGDLLWIECDPAEVSEHHLDPLRSTIAWTNALYKKGIETQKKSGKAKAEWFWLDHVTVADLTGSLNRGS
jgi:hypothetical protein